ncbi:unnamed protein product, partial [Ceratitis capitata]
RLRNETSDTRCNSSKTVYSDLVEVVGKDEFPCKGILCILVKEVVEKNGFPSHRIFCIIVELVVQKADLPSLPDDELDMKV